MKRFNRILFVADGSAGDKAALTNTIRMAADIKARVSVIDVIDEATEIFPITEGTVNLFPLQRELVKVRKDELEKLVKAARPRHLKAVIPVQVKQGKDFVEIIRTVRKDGFDLVVKASGKPHLTGMLFSTLDMNLVRKCPCPVLLVKPRKKIRHSRILASVDLRVKDKGQKNMDRTIMELASSLAAMEKGELHVLHAWNMALEKRLKHRPEVHAYYKSMGAMLKDMRDISKTHLNELAAEYALTTAETHLLKGDPATVIPRFVKNKRIDLVVMGTVGRSGIAGFFMGNTAEKVLNNINCSVLAIKPAGWKSPVK